MARKTKRNIGLLQRDREFRAHVADELSEYERMVGIIEDTNDPDEKLLGVCDLFNAMNGVWDDDGNAYHGAGCGTGDSHSDGED